jgi:hypothetical protein
MRIRDLRPAERALLFEVLSKRAHDLAYIALDLDHSITEAESEAFTNAVGDELVDAGLDANHEVNERGLRLDYLLGRVNSVRLD